MSKVSARVIIIPIVKLLLDSESRESELLNIFSICQIMAILNKEEKEQLILKLAMEGLPTRDIARLARASLKTIGTVVKKYNGEELEYPNNAPSVTSKAFQMFKDNKDKVDVAIALNLEAYEVESLFHDFMKTITVGWFGDRP